MVELFCSQWRQARLLVCKVEELSEKATSRCLSALRFFFSPPIPRRRNDQFNPCTRRSYAVKYVWGPGRGDAHHPGFGVILKGGDDVYRLKE